MSDARSHSSSFERNIGPITDILLEILPHNKSALLEIGSGSGQHVAHLAKVFPHIEFHPTEYSSDSLPSINDWADHFNQSNVRLAITLDAANPNWRVQDNFFSTLTAFNVIHYAPWEVTEKLFQHAGRYLTYDAQIILYGPYKIDGEHISQSNIDFDKWLKSVNPEFGVRDIDEVSEAAKRHKFTLDTLHPMPANNFMPIFKRA